jgi:hypothetical protein
MPLNSTDAQYLGDLINDLNPYYDGNINNWEMDIDVGTTVPAGPPSTPHTPPNVMLEVDDHYYGEWNFNGQPQKISRALRIKYRYPVSTPSGQVYWLEDYLLIGFQGADGGG